jgi:hypothetical protein
MIFELCSSEPSRQESLVGAKLPFFGPSDDVSSGEVQDLSCTSHQSA